MQAVIWAGATNASDVFLLIAAIVAGLATITTLFVGRDAMASLIPAAICLIALGLLAV